MHNSPLEIKRQHLRREIRGLRNAISQDLHKEKSLAVARHFLDYYAHGQGCCCFIYVGYGSEVDTLPIVHGILAEGGIVCVPSIDPENRRMEAVRINDPADQLAPGYKGIPEPLPSLVETSVVDPQSIDIALVPGLVFDHHGNRLGYGGGYYDRFLATRSPRALRIGLAFECQLTSLVPTQAHDIPMDIIITEEKTHRTHAR